MNNYYGILDEVAENGFDEFMEFLYNSDNLIYEIEETELGEREVEVFILDEDECSDFVGRYSFDEYGNYIM